MAEISATTVGTNAAGSSCADVAPLGSPSCERRLGFAADAELLVHVVHGSEAALAEVYERHAGPVYALARRILRDVHMAEDVVQEIFLRLWDRARAFDPRRGSLRTFLLVQARSRCLDVLRAESSRRCREGNEGRFLAAAEAQDEPHSLVAMKHDLGDMRAAIDVLSDDQRRTIELAYFGGYTCREVAELMQVPEGTVKSRIRLGLQRLRLLMAHAPGSEQDAS
jgi:RNA polymerase sigma-70 factor (ECF subfamily)